MFTEFTLAALADVHGLPGSRHGPLPEIKVLSGLEARRRGLSDVDGAYLTRLTSTTPDLLAIHLPHILKTDEGLAPKVGRGYGVKNVLRHEAEHGDQARYTRSFFTDLKKSLGRYSAGPPSVRRFLRNPSSIFDLVDPTDPVSTLEQYVDVADLSPPQAEDMRDGLVAAYEGMPVVVANELARLDGDPIYYPRGDVYERGANFAERLVQQHGLTGRARPLMFPGGSPLGSQLTSQDGYDEWERDYDTNTARARTATFIAGPSRPPTRNHPAK